VTALMGKLIGEYNKQSLPRPGCCRMRGCTICVICTRLHCFWLEFPYTLWLLGWAMPTQP